ncbi:MAG: asparaginase, partial [Clostridia bacterium]|nr:asparaginase [Clostridia bacterium]
NAEGPKTVRQKNLSAAGRLLTDFFAASDSPFAGQITFDQRAPLDVFSENMTPREWQRLLDFLREVDWQAYDGVIIAHGTDTLAYTSSLLSLALAGYTEKPIFLVSSDRTLSDPEANGHANFKAAAELIARGFGAGVYVPYRNADGVVYLHHGAHLLQCANFTADFYSRDMAPYTEAKPYAVQAEASMLDALRRLDDCVMRIEPYVGLDYAAYGLPKHIRAVLHGSYHSATACMDSAPRKAYSSRSVFYLMKRCRQLGIDVFLSPLRESQRADLAGSYDTVAAMLEGGMQPVFSLTNETAYMKLALAYSLGYEREEVGLFLDREVASEKLDY